MRIVLADDHQVMREGLRALLEKNDELDIVGEADDGRATIALVQKLKPDVVLMDVSMPGLNGVDATRTITAEYPTTKVLALSMHADRRFVTEMLRAGACGYLLKDGASEEIMRAIKIVSSGQVYLSPSITGVVVQDLVNPTDTATHTAFTLLTAREREILQLIAEGKPTKEIASHLNVSVKTVEAHRKNVMNKLNVDSIALLTKFAIREGLTGLEH